MRITEGSEAPTPLNHSPYVFYVLDSTGKPINDASIQLYVHEQGSAYTVRASESGFRTYANGKATISIPPTQIVDSWEVVAYRYTGTQRGNGEPANPQYVTLQGKMPPREWGKSTPTYVTPIVPTEPAGNSNPAPNVAQPLTSNPPETLPTSTIITETPAPTTPSAPENVVGETSETTDPTPYIVAAAVVVLFIVLLLVA